MKYIVTMNPEGQFTGLCSLEAFIKDRVPFLDDGDTFEVFDGPEYDGNETFERVKALAKKLCAKHAVLPEGLPTSYPVREDDQSPEKFARALRRRAEMPLPTPVLLLEEHDGWIALCRADTNMREVRGATIEEAQVSLRYRWENPLPLRFPDDFPLMDHEFDSMLKYGKLHQDDGQFGWYVLTIDDRERSLREMLDERLRSMKP